MAGGTVRIAAEHLVAASPAFRSSAFILAVHCDGSLQNYRVAASTADRQGDAGANYCKTIPAEQQAQSPYFLAVEKSKASVDQMKIPTAIAAISTTLVSRHLVHLATSHFKFSRSSCGSVVTGSLSHCAGGAGPNVAVPKAAAEKSPAGSRRHHATPPVPAMMHAAGDGERCVAGSGSINTKNLVRQTDGKRDRA